MVLKLITAPVTEPVSPDEAKLHIRKTGDDEDSLISSYIKSAREHAEALTGRALCTQKFELILDEFPDGDIELPMPPLQSVESIKYTGVDGIEVTWDDENYIVDSDSEPGKIVLAYGKSYLQVSLYPVGAVRIQFTAGYIIGEEETPAHLVIPEPIRQAMLLLIGHFYENREAVVIDSIPQKLLIAVESLLYPYKVWNL